MKVQNVSEKLPIDLYLDEDNFSSMPALERDKEIKLGPEETIAKPAKLYPQNIKTE